MKRFLFLVLAIFMLVSPVMIMAEQKVATNDTALLQISQLLDKIYADTKGVIAQGEKIAPEVVKAQIDYLIWANTLTIWILGIFGMILIVSGILCCIFFETEIVQYFLIVFGIISLLVAFGFCVDLKHIQMNPIGTAIEIIKGYILGK
jgi:hypothetical protein